MVTHNIFGIIFGSYKYITSNLITKMALCMIWDKELNGLSVQEVDKFLYYLYISTILFGFDVIAL